MAFNLDDYEPVASRVARFLEAHPHGAIHCDIVHDDGQRIVIRASVWRDQGDPMPSGVDYAEEHLTERGVNATSRIENCATSAVGRCLSLIGFASSDWTKKPSREEMSKVNRMTTRTDAAMPNTTIREPAGVASEKQVNFAKSLLKAAKLPVPADIASMSKGDISGMIEHLKAGTYAPTDDVEEPF